MPRAKKTNVGAPAQKIDAIKGQTYGEGVRQESLQRAMPAPNMQAIAPQPTAAPMSQSAPVTTAATPTQQQAPRMTQEDVVNRLRSAGGVLSAADDRPDLPVTDGLSTGPGRGPEALMRQPNRSGRLFRQLSIQTGDPIFAELAHKAGF